MRLNAMTKSDGLCDDLLPILSNFVSEHFSGSHSLPAALAQLLHGSGLRLTEGFTEYGGVSETIQTESPENTR